MTAGGATALEQALALHQAPQRVASVRAGPLPDNVELLLRLAAGESAALAQIQGVAPPEQCREAAIFYLQQVLFAPEADSFRVLGADARASEAQLKANHRWLIRWLHPDRQAGAWESVFADRVNAAWNDLRNAERRLAYLQQLAIERPTQVAPESGGWREDRPVAVPLDEPAPHRYPQARRNLPLVVLGAMALSAVVGLGLLYRAQQGQGDTVALADTGSGKMPLEAPAALAHLTPAPDRAVVDSELPIPAPSAQVPLPPPPIAATPHVAPVATAPPPVAAIPKRPEPAPAPARPAPDRRVATAAPAPARVRAVVPPAPVPAREPRVLPPEPPLPAPPPPQVVVMLAPAPAAPAGPAPLLDDHRARVVVDRFAQLLERGDVAGMRRLFSTAPDAELASTLQDYERLVADSDYRRIEFSRLSWLSSAGNGLGTGTGTILGNYSAVIVRPGAPQGTGARGVIRFDLRLEGGEPRIFRLRQEPAK